MVWWLYSEREPGNGVDGGRALQWKTQNYNTKHSASRHMLLPGVCGSKGMAVVVWLEVGAAVIPIELRNNRMLTCYVPLVRL